MSAGQARYERKRRARINRELEMIRVHRPVQRVPVPGDPWVVITASGRVGRWVALWP